MGVHAFPKRISPKVNVIAGLELKLVDCDVTVQHVSHNAKGIPTPKTCLFCEVCTNYL